MSSLIVMLPPPPRVVLLVDCCLGRDPGKVSSNLYQEHFSSSHIFLLPSPILLLLLRVFVNKRNKLRLNIKQGGRNGSVWTFSQTISRVRRQCAWSSACGSCTGPGPRGESFSMPERPDFTFMLRDHAILCHRDSLGRQCRFSYAIGTLL